VDVDPGTLNLDPTLVGQYLRDQRRPRTQTKNVRAILPVHLYGQCADMDGFDRIIKEHNKEHANDHADDNRSARLVLVEDAAQAIGAEWSGRPAGSLGITAAFSFYPTKNLSAYGEAGIVTTSSPQMAERMRQLRSHGSPRRYYHNELGWNGRMDAIQAAVLRVKLAHLPEWTRQRQQHAATYDRLFAASGLISVSPAQEISPHASPDSRPISQPISRPESHLISQPGSNERSAPTDAPVRLLARSPQATHVFHQYVIRAQRRDDLRKFLADRNIGSEVYYPLPLHLQPAIAYLGLKAGDMPVSEQAAQEVLALPMFPELTEIEIRHVVESIADFYS
jgi:dTDP-4-amino-4,6-dideoxygalactose transaminase